MSRTLSHIKREKARHLSDVPACNDMSQKARYS